MTVLLEIKEKLKSVYAEYAYAITLVLKLLLALTVFLSVNRTMGFWKPLENVFLIALLTLLCSLLSAKATAVFAGLFIIGHSYALGLEVLLVTAILFLLLFLFLLRFDEKDGLALLLTPLALSIGVPVLVPICYGLKRKPASSVSVAGGTIVYYYVCMLSEKASVLQNTDESDLFNSMLTNLRILVDGFLKNQLMLLTMAALVFTLCIVYVVRRLPLDHIWHIAIGTGAVVYLITMISGGLFLDINIAAGTVVAGTVISVLLALVMEFFVLNVDYSRTERMEFEDDEYYYYVKAVPKITISKSRREIKTISSESEPVIVDDPAAEEAIAAVVFEETEDDTADEIEIAESEKKQSQPRSEAIKAKIKQLRLKLSELLKKLI